ncbi:hypothetical protein [Macrococcus brunensis]|uniref:hypothetical protein n=1 Tax=Macrococcus brunensis TaxID=198483 RepID=UPI001EF05E01|nr:hypothetical protein [Macrococcus brunensis]ULG73186.1 hypothetical protein MGG13_05530 [Macrococcus brunensis]
MNNIPDNLEMAERWLHETEMNQEKKESFMTMKGIPFFSMQEYELLEESRGVPDRVEWEQDSDAGVAYYWEEV